MKYLVTGACGFIGQHTIQRLLQEGHSVIGLDNAISNEIVGVDYRLVDISDYRSLKPHFDGVEVVIHLAALSNTKMCMENPLLCNKVNVTGTLNVLEASRMNQVKKVVCASSHVVLAGMHPLRMSKMAVENYCTLYRELYQVPVICLRYAAIYGPGQVGGNVLNAFRQAVQSKGEITIFGTGEQERDFLHVSDCVEANYLASQSELCGIFDICTGKLSSLNYIAKQLFKAKVVYQETRAGDAETFNQDPGPARKLLKFEAKISLEEGIKDYL